MAQKPKINQAFIDMFNPVETFDVMGAEIKAKALTLHDIAELQSTFPQWQTTNTTDLLNDDSFGVDALTMVIWIGTRENTPELADIEVVKQVVTAGNHLKWRPVLHHVAGLPQPTEEDDDTDLPPDPETPAKTAEKND